MASRDFQVFVKPVGPVCNLGCHYCYYLDKTSLYMGKEEYRMPHEVLEAYIAQHMETSTGDVVRFSWHGGEPTVLGLDFFREVVEIQQRYKTLEKSIINGIQTNGTLLDDEWCSFLAEEGFTVGVSLDGPQVFHDKFRRTRDDRPSFEAAMRGYKLLQKHSVPTEVLCVVSSVNVGSPLVVYGFFRGIGARYISFLPLVVPDPVGVMSEISVSADEWGRFLCSVFDKWIVEDVGRVDVQIFEEALRWALGLEHSLCIFRPVCGDVPVVEHNGDYYVCDHYVNVGHRLGNITETRLVELLESKEQRCFGLAKQEALPVYCRECNVLPMCNGGCPKNRFIDSPKGEPGLNYLCEGYRRFFNHSMPFALEVARLRGVLNSAM